MISRKTLSLVALFAALSFVACDNDPAPKKINPTPTVPTVGPTLGTVITQPPVSKTPTYSALEQRLLYVVRNGSYSEEFRNVSDTTILTVGYAFCAELESGISTDEVIDRLQSEMEDAGSSLQEMKAAGFLLGASVATFCPEYISDFE